VQFLLVVIDVPEFDACDAIDESLELMHGLPAK
jgi:hypothetical protein